MTLGYQNWSLYNENLLNCFHSILGSSFEAFKIHAFFMIRCMGHNKGWEEAASMFSGDKVELKTCNAALLEASGRSWIEVCFFEPQSMGLLIINLRLLG
jgi:hypothetical protein